MAFENARSISMLPTATEAVAAYRFVTLTSGGTVQHSAADAEPVGIALVASPDSDLAGVSMQAATAAIPVALLDGAKLEVEAGDAIAVGGLVAVGANGKAVASNSGAAIVGQALSASTADGQIITIVAYRSARTVA